MANYSTDLYHNTDTFEVLKFENESQWLDARKLGLGGTDASVACGINPWKTPQELFLEKTNRMERKDLSKNKSIQYGRQAEEHIRQLFMLGRPNLKMNYLNYVILRNKENPELQCSPDGLIEDQYGNVGLWECKTANCMNQKTKSEWDDKIPIHYYYQVLHSLNVTGLDFVIVTAKLKYSSVKSAIVSYRFNMNDEGIVEDVIEVKTEVLNFWHKIKNDKK